MLILSSVWGIWTLRLKPPYKVCHTQLNVTCPKWHCFLLCLHFTCMCVVHVCMCVQMNVSMCLWWLQVGVGCLPLQFSFPNLFTEAESELKACLFDWLSSWSKPMNPLPPTPKCWDYSCLSMSTQLFTLVVGITTPVHMLVRPVLCLLSHLPSSNVSLLI